MWYFVFFKKNTLVPDENMVSISEQNNDIVQEEETVIPDWYAYDKDGDTIEDTKEEELGTSMWEPDSDFDGLTDEIEINQYKTDPTKSDTDGDGYWDGLEIITGYNPLGEGKL